LIASLRYPLGIAVAATAAAVLLLVLVFREGKQAGKTEDLERTVKTQERINDADARGPRTPDDVDKRLRDGHF
jgi:hypothetical protein